MRRRKRRGRESGKERGRQEERATVIKRVRKRRGRD